jgi:hypothetical protein
MYINCRQLNLYTIKIEFHVFNADMLFDMLSGALVYSALNLAVSYYHFRFNPKETHITAFKTQFGKFEWLPSDYIYPDLLPTPHEPHS